MDNLINRIRGEQTESKNDTKESINDSIITSDVISEMNTTHIQTNDTVLIRTSQADALDFATSTLNLTKLQQHNKNSMKSIELVKLEGYKIDQEICLIIKKKIKYRDVYSVILADETGSITGHTNVDSLNVGDIVILNGCGLWKCQENELNIVYENIVKVIKADKSIINK